MILQSLSSPSSSNFISDHPLLTLLDQKCATMRDLKKLHAQIIKTGLHRDTLAASRVLAFTATHPSGDINYALAVFDRIQNPNLFAWNTILRGFSRSSAPHHAITLFIQMLADSSVKPNRLTYPSLFKAYAQMGLARFGAQLHGRVKKQGLDASPFVRNTIIYMYANCGFLDEASRIFSEEDRDFDVVAWNSMMLGFAKTGMVEECRRLFDKMGRRRTAISWNTVISGYVRKGAMVEAFELFGMMQEEKIRPSEFTMVSLLNACAHLGAFEQGRWIYYYICENYHGFELNPIVVTAVVNMYCKCGAIEEARRFFEASPKKGLSCWNSMILGLANNGHEDEAMALFEELEMCKIKPDGVTFLGVLMACVYLGDVNKAREYFSLMVKKYGIEPSIKHYCCMVEGLGKAGLIGEAERLISGMPMKPDVVVWGSLLSSCRRHGDVEMARLAASQMSEIEGGESSMYVLMSNVLARCGEYESAIEQRVAMKERHIVKEKGSSVIEVDGDVQEFTSGGRLRPRMLEELMLLL